MPTLTYPTGNFQPFTKILSAEVNGKFNAITTLLNITKLDHSNVQLDRLLGAVQLSTQVAVTNSLGVLTLITTLPVANGGLGFSPVLTTTDAGLVVQVNGTGTALTLAANSTPTGLLYAFNHTL